MRLGGDGALTISGNMTAANYFGNGSGLSNVVTSVGASGPLVSSGGTTPSISIPAASSSVDGYLTSGNWTTFNGKLGTTLASGNIWVGSAGGVATAVALSGHATVSNTGSLSISAGVINTGHLSTVAGPTGLMESRTYGTQSVPVLNKMPLSTSHDDCGSSTNFITCVRF
jgi:hypothetical protein